MKNIYYSLIILFLGIPHFVSAQFEGQKFLSGSASIMFNGNKPKQSGSTDKYGYNFDINLGKFKSNTRASGWKVNTWLEGSKNQLRIYSNTGNEEFERSGINGIGAGIGRFWDFYKHFNDKTGIFAGPDLNLSYNRAHVYSTNNDATAIIKNSKNEVFLSFGVHAGLYYKLSEKWWITANIALANPAGISYSRSKQTVEETGDQGIQKTLNYYFNPRFTFPSVGFGLRFVMNGNQKDK